MEHMATFRPMPIRSLFLAALSLLFLIGPTLPALAYHDNGGHAATKLEDISSDQLPPEAQRTLDLVKAGGPFPYTRDGIPFGNRERLLPPRERGYYREYTVPTPGARNRGARRIIAGTPGEYYYTDDHYRSFRRIGE
jgi:ribonuclease T1